MQVSDAGIAMFGFANETERDFFMELLHVKTIGGKLAIMLMRYLDMARIVEAIKAGNVSALSVPGLGAKRAERICFELKSKVEKEFASVGAEFPAARLHHSIPSLRRRSPGWASRTANARAR